METVTNLKPLLSKSLASTLLGVWGWWTYDVFTLMATYRGTSEIGAQIILRSVGMLTYMIPFGISGGCSILFGKSVGQKNAALALQYYRVSQIIAVLVGLITMLVLYLCRDLIIEFFTSDVEMIA